MPSRTDLPPRSRGPIGRVALTLDASAKARRSALGLFGVLAYLLLGQTFASGFTEYWWYQLAQTGATLAVVPALETIFAREGGLAWQTHAIVVVTTCVDVFGTAGHLYDAWGPYDKIVHFWSGVAFAAGTDEVLRLLDRRGTIVVSARRRALLAVLVSFAIAGVAWEGYEHVSDAFFHSGRVQSRWDTIGDLIANAVGSVTAVAVLRTREVVRTQPAGKPTDSSRITGANPAAGAAPGHDRIQG